MARGQWIATTELVEKAKRILSAEQPMTIRQLFYRLVSVQALENSIHDYKKLSRVMTDAREGGQVPFEWIVDRSRPTYAPSVFDDIKDGLIALRRCYRKDYWEDQFAHVEIWTEKDAIIGSIEPVTDELGVTVRVSRGFTSTTRVYEIASAFTRILKPIFVFYLGDHDPSGRAIELDLYQRIASYGSDFEMERLAVRDIDINAFNLPPLRIKSSDTRAAAFRRKFGNRCVELDALPPEELRLRVRQAIERHIEGEAWERALAIERAERESIQSIVERWNDPRRQGEAHPGGPDR
jgi:hypothetical protein